MEIAAKKILMIDDEPVSVRVASRILEKHYLVDSALSGAAGLEKAFAAKPDLILLDISMPDINGFTILSTLKQDKELKNVPVIFLTGTDDTQAEIDGFAGGAEDFIKKPFVPQIMLMRVKHVLEMYELKFHLQAEVERQMHEVRERQTQLERMAEDTMVTLANTIDAKDRYTSGHSRRVAEYAREIAKRDGKSPAEQKHIFFMGLLHDIGKIGVPDDIINKPGKLTDEEYEAIKSHTVIGHKILESMKAIHDLSLGARWHHERYDGRGYPDKLAGENIPEAARIIGVADSYDAMSSSRSYREYLPQAVIRDEIVKNSGTQFDPHFAEIMLEMIAEDTEYKLHES